MREYKLLFDNDCQAAAKFLPEKRVITPGASLFLAKVEANDQEGLQALGRKEIPKFNSASRHSVRKKVSSLTAVRGLLPFPSATCPRLLRNSYRERALTNRASGTLSHCVRSIARGNPIRGPDARFVSIPD